MVGALSGQRAYWSNVSDEGSGWVAKLDLTAGTKSGGHQRLRERLSARESRLLGVGAIEVFDDPLYARYTHTSELSYVVPPLGEEPRLQTLAEVGLQQDCTLIEYFLLR